MKSKIHKYRKNSFKIVSTRLIVLVLLMVGTTGIAQERYKKHHRKNKIEQFTPEQRNELMVKKMALELDLNSSQQKEISALLSEKLAKRKAFKTEKTAQKEKEKGTELTRDERFAVKSKILDEQIAIKTKMKKILNEKQYEKWTALKKDNHNNYKEFRKEKHLKHQGRRG